MRFILHSLAKLHVVQRWFRLWIEDINDTQTLYSVKVIKITIYSCVLSTIFNYVRFTAQKKEGYLLLSLANRFNCYTKWSYQLKSPANTNTSLSLVTARISTMWSYIIQTANKILWLLLYLRNRINVTQRVALSLFHKPLLVLASVLWLYTKYDYMRLYYGQ